MALNRQKTFYSRIAAYGIASGYSITDEGQVLAGVRENGVQVARPSAGSSTHKTLDGVEVGTEEIVGFSYNTSFRATTRVEMALVTVPTIGSGAIGTVSLPRTSLNSGSVRVVLTATNAALTVDAVTATPLSVTSGHVAVWLAKGLFYFNAANTDASVLITYRYTLSATELALFVREAHPNANSTPFLESIQVVRGNGDLFTDWFDTTADYSSATKLYAGPNGLVTSQPNDGQGTPALYYAPISGSEILQTPTIDDDANLQFGVTLGFRYNIG